MKEPQGGALGAIPAPEGPSAPPKGGALGPRPPLRPLAEPAAAELGQISVQAPDGRLLPLPESAPSFRKAGGKLQFCGTIRSAAIPAGEAPGRPRHGGCLCGGPVREF